LQYSNKFIKTKENDETNIGRTRLIPKKTQLRDYTTTISLKILSENPVKKKSWWKKNYNAKQQKQHILMLTKSKLKGRAYS